MGAEIQYNDKVANAIITYTTQAPTHPWLRTADNSPQNKGRSTGTVNQRVIFNFGSPQLLEGFSWFGSNLATGDTATFEAGTTSATLNETADLTEDSKGHITFGWAAYQYFAIDVTMNVLPYFEAGKFGLWEKSYPLPASWKWGRNFGGYGDGDLDVFTQNDGGEGQISRELEYSKQLYDSLYFRAITDAQFLIMKTINKSPFITFYDHVKDEVFFGVFKLSGQTKIKTNKNDVTADFEEAL